MNNAYLEYYKKIAIAYEQVGGYTSLCDRINAGEFRDGFSELQNKIANEELQIFFVNNRIFGLTDFWIKHLAGLCEEKEKLFNTSHQQS